MIVISIMCNDIIFAQFGYETDKNGKITTAFIDCIYRHSHKCISEKFNDFKKAEQIWETLTEYIFDGVNTVESIQGTTI